MPPRISQSARDRQILLGMVTCCKCGGPVRKVVRGGAVEVITGQLHCSDCREFVIQVFEQLRKVNKALKTIGCHPKIADRRTLALSHRLWQEFLAKKEAKKKNGRRRADG